MSRLKTEQPVKLLSPSYEEAYEKRREMSDEISRLEKLMKDLRTDRGELDAKLAKAFAESNRRRLSDGTVVEYSIVEIPEVIITEEMVGEVKRAGFSYPKYKEIAER